MSLTPGAQAKNLDFPDTPVKTISAPGNWGTPQISRSRVDAGQWTSYKNSDDELGVVVFDIEPGTVIEKILQSKDGELDSKQIEALSREKIPSELRRSNSEGKSKIKTVKARKLLSSDFIHEDRMLLTRAGQPVCIPNSVYETHAFGIDKGKLFQIYLLRYRHGEDKNPDLMKSLSSEFHSILSTVEWK